jgi:prevent-host-death family protein
MNVTVKEFRTQPSRILSLVQAGNDVTITLRGKPAARIVPIQDPQINATDDFFIGFGIWKDREVMADASAYVEAMREGRKI